MKCMLVEYEEQTESEMVVRPHEISLLYFLISSKQFLRAQQVMDQFGLGDEQTLGERVIRVSKTKIRLREVNSFHL